MQKALAAWFLLSMAPASAPGPTESLQAGLHQVNQVMDAPAGVTDARRVELRRVVDRLFDFREMARRSLGRHWTDRTAQERDEFVAAFRDLVERAYLARVEKMAGERVTWGPESVDGGTATVRSRVAAGRQGEIAMAYRLHQLGSRWAIYDVAVDGISLVSSYRSQFARIIQTSSYGELMRRLRARDAGATTIEPAATR